MLPSMMRRVLNPSVSGEISFIKSSKPLKLRGWLRHATMPLRQYRTRSRPVKKLWSQISRKSFVQGEGTQQGSSFWERYRRSRLQDDLSYFGKRILKSLRLLPLAFAFQIGYDAGWHAHLKEEQDQNLDQGDQDLHDDLEEHAEFQRA